MVDLGQGVRRRTQDLGAGARKRIHDLGAGIAAVAPVSSAVQVLAARRSWASFRNHEDGAGGVAADISGNGNDYAYEGTYTPSASGLFEDDGPGVVLPGSANAGVQGVETYGPSVTVYALFKATKAGAQRIIASAATGFLILRTSGSVFQAYQGGWASFGVNCNQNQRYFIAFVVDNAASEAHLYVNGLKMATITHTGRTGSDTQTAFGDLWDSAGSVEQLGGTLSMSGIYSGVVAADDIYADWQVIQAGGDSEEHWWKEVAEPNGLDTNCIFHAPLMEEGGSQIVDASGSQNHGTNQGTTLQQSPTTPYAMYGVLLDGVSHIAAPGADINSGMTVKCRFTSTNVSANRTLWELDNGAGAYIELNYRNAPDNDLYVVTHDGVNSPITTIFTDVPIDMDTCDIVIRTDGSDIECWVNGTKSATVSDISGLSVPDLSGETLKFGEGSTGNGAVGKLELPYVSSSAESDDNCVRLSGGTP
jgi:hypothetical protein